MEQEIAKPLELVGAYNVRDLGVYENKEHQKLKEHQFLRADSLHQLTEKDQEVLLSYGVKAVIDLRSQREREQAPCVWENSAQVDYYSVPMLDEMNSNGFQGEMPESMGKLYIELLENGKGEYAKIFQTMCKYKDRCVVFNCTAGKDRTGVIAMLLLSLAGVDAEVIAQDYSVSEKYMEPIFKQQKEQMQKYGVEIPEYILKSPEEEMKKTLDYLYENYGTVENYLNKIGLTQDEICVLKEKMCA